MVNKLQSFIKLNKIFWQLAWLISLKIYTGNNIPQDIVQALSVAIQQNSDRQVAFEEHQAQTEALTRELEMTQEKKRQEVCSFAIKMITNY